MDKELVKTVEDIVNEGRFRNKSHIIEYALKSFLRDQNETRRQGSTQESEIS